MAMAAGDEIGHPAPADGLRLERFLPYRLSVLTNTISRNLARVYARRFDLSVPEWRVMAVLGRFPDLSAAEVAERSAMDKVRVSRAVARLLRRGRLHRSSDGGDRRRSMLRLSPQGQAIYRQIVPLALAYQSELLSALTPAERLELDRLLDRLLGRAAALLPDASDG